MPIDKFIKHTSTCVPLPIENVDTDQIVPARYLKATTRQGFGVKLFYDWRYDANGKPRTDFVFNNPKYSGSILMGGKNFGSGSSREHAAWAVKDYGFKAVVSSYFADIFKSNAMNNGLLPVQVTESFLKSLFDEIFNDPATKVEIDLQNQTITILKNQLTEKFKVSEYKKNCLLNGFDDIDYLISKKDLIEQWEKMNNSVL